MLQHPGRPGRRSRPVAPLSPIFPVIAAALLPLAALAGCAAGQGAGPPGAAPRPAAAAPSLAAAVLTRPGREVPGAAPIQPARRVPAAAASGTARGIPAAATNWTAYHGNAARTGAVAGLPAAGTLSVAWTRKLGGAVYGQPLVVGGTVLAATESDQVYALSRATGKVLWHVGLGSPVPHRAQPCGDISPLGITGTPVYDAATGLVYAVAETAAGAKALAGIRVSDGAVAFRRAIPAPDSHPRYDQQSGALALDQGRVYLTLGGQSGGCGGFRGSVVAVPASGQGALLSYLVPTRKGAGLWAPGGPVVGPDGTLYVAAGPGAATKAPFDGSDSVIALSPELKQLGVFAPARWTLDNADGTGLGGMSPALLASGRILQVGDSSEGYLLNAGQLGGVGGQLADGAVCTARGGAAVSGSTVYVPCTDTGLSAVSLQAGHLLVRWRGPSAASGSPVVGGGAVWVTGGGAGNLYELAPATGLVEHLITLGTALPPSASPALSGGLAILGTMHGVVAVSGA
jgi:outer membrane protein assembly factor BamB